MRRKRNVVAIVLGGVLVAENLWVFRGEMYSLLVGAEQTEVARGRRLAGELGCFACHGPLGRQGIKNPGSEGETVPTFHEGTPMMYARGDQEIREYILDGAPAARRARESYREEMARQALQMPAYRGYVSESDVDALVAYVRAASDLLLPADEALVRGANLTREYGCFECHGEMGGGGVPNPGSFKGYIPALIGEDFEELAPTEEDLLIWIRKGAHPAISEDPIGGRFFRAQRIRMPAYERYLSEEQIRDIAAYVRWLARREWARQPLVK